MAKTLPCFLKECASEPLGTYTLSLHIAAIFIVLGVALLGTALPVIARSHPRWRIPDFGFLIGKTFGTGVILATGMSSACARLRSCDKSDRVRTISTGFVHMMSPAQDVLTSPCLSAEFNENYRAYAGMIALFSALTTHLIQTLAIQHFSTRKGRVKGSTAGDTGAVQAKVPDVASSSTESVNDVTASQTPGVRFDSLADHNYTLSKRADVRHSDDYGEHGQSEHLTVHRHWAENEDHRDSCGHAHASRRHSHSQAGPLPPRLSSAHAINDTTDSHYHTVELGALTTATNIHSDGCCDVDHLLLSHNHRQITAYVLELGIALHSLIIGLTLGVAADAEFLTLLVALSFHQFFEGFALSMTGIWISALGHGRYAL